MHMDFQKNLNRISDLEERRLLRDILNSVIEGVLEYDETLFQKVEERVFGELEYQEMRYSIVSTLIHREDYDPIHDNLFPMLEEDINKTRPDFSALTDPLNQTEVFLERVFLECDYQMVKRLFKSICTYSGTLITDKEEHHIKVKLFPSMVYLDQIRLLYETFQQNGILWMTVNVPYLFKFADIKLQSVEPPIKPEEAMKSFKIDWEDLENIIKENRIPLWNIETYYTQTMSFPVPVLNGVNYEHVIAVKKNDKNCGYLVVVPDGMSCYIKQNGETIIITAPIDVMSTWKLMRIVPPNGEIIYKGAYPLMGNRTKNNFINRLESNGRTMIRTKGELMRLVSSFEAAENLELVDFYIKEKVPEEIETYSMDFFLADGIREERYKKCMVLEFIKRGASSSFDRDRISFLVSVVQMSFPEYYCVGRLKKNAFEGE